MPVYNSEKYVSEAIESVRNQSYENWELLIVNDGSTDMSHTLHIYNLGQNFSPEKLLHFFYGTPLYENLF